MPHGQIYAMGDGIFWMTKRTYQRFKKQITSSSELSSALEKRKEIRMEKDGNDT